MQSTLKRLCFILFLCSNHVFFAQNSAVISSERMNLLYVGISNPVNIAMEKVSNSKLKVTINEGGLIEKYKDGTYNIVVNHQGKYTITVEGNGMIIKKDFRAKNIPNPWVSLNIMDFEGDTISVSMVKAITGLGSNQINLDFELGFSIDKFSILIKQANGNLKVVENKGAGFSSELLEILTTLKGGDYILFYDIYGHYAGEQNKRKLGAISFVIK
jgi:GldM C-terminal domain